MRPRFDDKKIQASIELQIAEELERADLEDLKQFYYDRRWDELAEEVEKLIEERGKYE